MEGPNAGVTPHATQVMTPLTLDRPVGSVVHCLRTFALSLVEGPNAGVTPHATQSHDTAITWEACRKCCSLPAYFCFAISGRANCFTLVKCVSIGSQISVLLGTCIHVTNCWSRTHVPQNHDAAITWEASGGFHCLCGFFFVVLFSRPLFVAW